MDAYLVLENGTTFKGEFFGKEACATGEIVFTTGMNGYLETFSDPSYHGQIILHTFPLVGNCGVINSDLESDFIGAKAYIVKYPCQNPSNFRSDGDLDTFFMSKGIVGIKGIDTRELTKIIRDNGTIKGKITQTPPTDADIKEAQDYTITDAIAAVSRKQVDVYGSGNTTVALLDFGVCKSTINQLTTRGCTVHVFPHNATLNDILAINPNGILLSGGPGNPQDPANAPILETLRALKGIDIPMFGIGMGHLLFAIANGFKVKQLKHGHRGSNQPVKDVATGRVYITNQNHSHTVIANAPWFVNVNDGTCEGLDYGNSFSVQFRPCSGPKDTLFLFDRFVERMANTNATR